MPRCLINSVSHLQPPQHGGGTAAAAGLAPSSCGTLVGPHHSADTGLDGN